MPCPSIHMPREVPIEDCGRDPYERSLSLPSVQGRAWALHTMTYCVASTGSQRLQPKGMRPGRRVSPPGTRVPSGLTHAYDALAERVACGADASGLYIFEDLTWPAGSFLRRCRECETVIDS